MNAPVRFDPDGQTHLFTLDQVWGMVAAGILDPDARVELIEGELIDMAPQNAPHMEAKRALITQLVRRLSDTFAIHVEGTLSLSPRSAPSPDIFVHAVQHKVDQVRGPDVLLLIEVSDSTLAYDLGRKAKLYAKHGVGDYWVVDVYGRRVVVHREPSQDGYGVVTEHHADDTVEALNLSGFAINSADIKLFP